MQTRRTVVLRCYVSRHGTVVPSRDHSVHCEAGLYVLLSHRQLGNPPRKDSDDAFAESAPYKTRLAWLDRHGR